MYKKTAKIILMAFNIPSHSTGLLWNEMLNEKPTKWTWMKGTFQPFVECKQSVNVLLAATINVNPNRLLFCISPSLSSSLPPSLPPPGCSYVPRLIWWKISQPNKIGLEAILVVARLTHVVLLDGNASIAGTELPGYQHRKEYYWQTVHMNRVCE